MEQILPFVASADAMVVGPGLTDQDSIDSLVSGILESAGQEAHLLFDARAIKSLKNEHAVLGRRANPGIITPQ